MKPANRPLIWVATVNNTAEVNEYVKNAFFGMGWVLGWSGIKAVSKTYDNHPISVARNVAVKDFLSHQKFTHIMFIDSDTVVPVDAILKMLKHDVPVCSGFYLARKGTGLIVVMKRKTKRPKVFPPRSFPFYKGMRVKEFDSLQKNAKGLVKVDAVGAGCLLIKREVFPRLSEPFFKEDWSSKTGKHHHYGEDVYFSLNCEHHKVPIYVDPTVFCAHVAWTVLDRVYLEEFRKMKDPPEKGSM